MSTGIEKNSGDSASSDYDESSFCSNEDIGESDLSESDADDDDDNVEAIKDGRSSNNELLMGLMKLLTILTKRFPKELLQGFGTERTMISTEKADNDMRNENPLMDGSVVRLLWNSFLFENFDTTRATNVTSTEDGSIGSPLVHNEAPSLATVSAQHDPGQSKVSPGNGNVDVLRRRSDTLRDVAYSLLASIIIGQGVADDNGENINDRINVNLQTLMVHGLMPLRRRLERRRIASIAESEWGEIVLDGEKERKLSAVGSAQESCSLENRNNTDQRFQVHPHFLRDIYLQECGIGSLPMTIGQNNYCFGWKNVQCKERQQQQWWW